MSTKTHRTSSVRIKEVTSDTNAVPVGMGDLISAASLSRNLLRLGLLPKVSTLVRIVPLTFSASESAILLLTASLAISVASAVIRLIEITTGTKIELLEGLINRDVDQIIVEVLIVIYKNLESVSKHSRQSADALIEIANALGSRGVTAEALNKVIDRVNERSLEDGRYLWPMPTDDGWQLGFSEFAPWQGTTIIGPSGGIPFSIPTPSAPGGGNGGAKGTGIFDKIQIKHTMLA